MTQIARKACITREGLDKALSGSGNPSFPIIVEVAHGLGVRVSFQGLDEGRGGRF
jgi:probable addiction module antidote protein